MRRSSNWRVASGLGAALGLAAALGFGLAFWLQSDALQDGPGEASGGSGAAARARQAGAASIARQRLEARVSQLEEDLNDLANLFAAKGRAALDPNNEASLPPEPAPGPEGSEQGPSFDEAALAQAGLDPSETARVRAQWERLLLSRLGLSNLALREGWFRSKRYASEQRELESTLRSDFGERDYELMLYATGRSTRLVVREVIPRAAANTDGIEAGDTILRYDGERMFQPRDLRWATAAGELGSSVWIEVLRAGERRRLSVRRGPLGIVLVTESLPPFED